MGLRRGVWKRGRVAMVRWVDGVEAMRRKRWAMDLVIIFLSVAYA